MYIYIYICNTYSLFRIRSPEFCLKHLQPQEALGRMRICPSGSAECASTQQPWGSAPPGLPSAEQVHGPRDDEGKLHKSPKLSLVCWPSGDARQCAVRFDCAVKWGRVGPSGSRTRPCRPVRKAGRDVRRSNYKYLESSGVRTRPGVCAFAMAGVRGRSQSGAVRHQKA